MNRGSSITTAPASRTAPGFNEAPIHESGKWDRSPPAAPPHRLASMRPRFMNRGSGGMDNGVVVHDARFNEAPIHESGKCVPMRTRRPPSTGFNEAPIHESGK